MSYTRRCAHGQIGKIKQAAEQSPAWECVVLKSKELCVSRIPGNNEGSHFIFGFIDVEADPETTVRSVACYAGPSTEDIASLNELIRSTK